MSSQSDQILWQRKSYILCLFYSLMQVICMRDFPLPKSCDQLDDVYTAWFYWASDAPPFQLRLRIYCLKMKTQGKSLLGNYQPAFLPYCGRKSLVKMLPMWKYKGYSMVVRRYELYFLVLPIFLRVNEMNEWDTLTKWENIRISSGHVLLYLLYCYQ